MNYKDIYKRPFHTDEYGIYMFSGPEDDCSVTALDCHTDDTGEVLVSLCNFLNHDIDVFQPKITKVTSNRGDCAFKIETGDTISVRGWGYLTGTLGLSFTEAAAIQDAWLQEVITRIRQAQATH